VSSHALALSRVDALAFDVGVFTNLTQDHLDFHGTLEEYGRAKRRLFELLAASPKPRRVAVVNGDDPAAARMVAGLGLETLTYGLGPDNRVRASEWTSTLDGVRLTVATPAGRLALASPLIGEHNVMNLLAALGVGWALGWRRTPPPARSAACRRCPAGSSRCGRGNHSSSSWITPIPLTRWSGC